MRKIERIFVHCTAGSQRQSIEDLKAEFRLKGWKYPGYHYVVDINGGIHQLLAIELVSNGKPIDNRTPDQKDALILLLHRLKQQFPDAKIMGHRDIWGSDQKKWKKYCPCFDAMSEYKDIE